MLSEWNTSAPTVKRAWTASDGFQVAFIPLVNRSLLKFASISAICSTGMNRPRAPAASALMP